jgi:hypothetical protein
MVDWQNENQNSSPKVDFRVFPISESSAFEPRSALVEEASESWLIVAIVVVGIA